MADLLKHGLYRYCDKQDCQWFSRCGVALTDAIYVKALTEGLDIPKKEHCANYGYSYSARDKRK